MIIWGSKGRERTVASGEFYCPQCLGHSPYIRRRVSRYFTLYFIPLFPLETYGEYVECRTCGVQLAPEVLDLSAEQIHALTQPWDCESCGNRNSASEAACINCGVERPAPFADASADHLPIAPA
jgi:hypothetical protein